MSNSRRGLWFWVYVWFPVLLGIVIIALESQEFMGADHTSHPLRMLFQFIFGPIGDARWDLVHH